MKVIIPLAGKGTRLRPHTYVTPKPLIKVGGKTVMSYILDDLRELGVTEGVFITGYLKDKIEDYMKSDYPDFKVQYVEQEVQNGTAGAIALAEPYVQEDCLIIFVDTLFDADLGLTKTLPADVAGILWAKEVEDYQRFGVLVTDEAGFMTRIVEKPQDPISKLANIGLYYIRDWKLLFEGVRSVMEGPTGKSGEYYLTDAFQYMVDRGAKLKIVEVEGWYDAGEMGTLLETNAHVLANGGRARKPDGGRNVKCHDPVRIAEGVTLEDCHIGPNVTVETGCVIRHTTLRDTIVGENTTIEDADLSQSVIGSNCVVRGVKGSVNLGDHSSVTAGE
ncbi:MAG TPA: sugar phosphate nucleotidyltransferase [Longimicrobiales bacterium]